MNMPRAAIVMAAGLGERMRPLTLERPKPLLELGGKPLIDYALDHLADAGIDTVIVNLHYKGEMLRNHLAGRMRPPIHFQPEETLLDTGGSARQALAHMGGSPFFAVNADTVYQNGSGPTLARMAQRWDDTAMDALLLLVPTPENESGDYAIDGAGRLTYRPDGRSAPYGFRAVSLLHPRLFDGAPEGRVSLKLLWDRAEATGRLFGLVHDGACYHLSTPADLARANESFA